MTEPTRTHQRPRVLTRLLAALLCSLASAAAAEAPLGAEAPADAALAAKGPAEAAPTGAALTLLAATCFNCHGTDGRLHDDGIPAIAGKPQQVLETQLQAFKRGLVPATVMDRIAGGFSDAELAALAAHFAALDAPAMEQR